MKPWPCTGKGTRNQNQNQTDSKNYVQCSRMKIWSGLVCQQERSTKFAKARDPAILETPRTLPTPRSGQGAIFLHLPRMCLGSGCSQPFLGLGLPGSANTSPPPSTWVSKRPGRSMAQGLRERTFDRSTGPDLQRRWWTLLAGGRKHHQVPTTSSGSVRPVASGRLRTPLTGYCLDTSNGVGPGI